MRDGFERISYTRDTREDRQGGGREQVLLAAAMGHESETTTTERDAGRKAVQQAGLERVTAALH